MNLCEFKASLVYRASSRTAKTTQRNSVSKSQEKKKEKKIPWWVHQRSRVHPGRWLQMLSDSILGSFNGGEKDFGNTFQRLLICLPRCWVCHIDRQGLALWLGEEANDSLTEVVTRFLDPATFQAFSIPSCFSRPSASAHTASL